MSDKPDSLTDEDVRQIGLLIEMLDRSSFDYLRIDTGNLKVVVGKGAAPPEESTPVAAAPLPAAAPEAPRPAAAPAVSEEGVVDVTAPMIGRFYAQPEPGAAPFVTVGSPVNATTTIGLLEVMKVYTSVAAGVDGVISEICVKDGAFVEFGAVLFRIRKVEGAPAGKRSSPPATKAKARR